MFEECERMCPVPIRMGSSQALAPHKKYLTIVIYIYIIYIYCITWYTYVVHLSVVGVCAHKYRQSLMTFNSIGKVYSYFLTYMLYIMHMCVLGGCPWHTASIQDPSTTTLQAPWMADNHWAAATEHHGKHGRLENADDKSRNAKRRNPRSFKSRRSRIQNNLEKNGKDKYDI